jgi:hypothetical protein
MKSVTPRDMRILTLSHRSSTPSSQGFHIRHCISTVIRLKAMHTRKMIFLPMRWLLARTSNSVMCEFEPWCWLWCVGFRVDSIYQRPQCGKHSRQQSSILASKPEGFEIKSKQANQVSSSKIANQIKVKGSYLIDCLVYLIVYYAEMYAEML